MKDDKVYIEHILEAIGKIEIYLNGVSSDQFLKDGKTLDAVTRELEIVGEAANRISEEFQGKHPELPWNEMVSMRNRLIHEYFGVNEEIVWSTCTEDLPPLKEMLANLIQ